jgi:hypothetical protein
MAKLWKRSIEPVSRPCVFLRALGRKGCKLGFFLLLAALLLAPFAQDILISRCCDSEELCEKAAGRVRHTVDAVARSVQFLEKRSFRMEAASRNQGIQFCVLKILKISPPLTHIAF